MFDSDPSGGDSDQAPTATGSNKAPKQSKRYPPKVTSTKPTIVVGVALDKLLGLNPDAAAEVIGCGPIADSVLAVYILDANIVGMLFGQHGQPLWVSRQIRLASMAQQLAPVIRDKRCVLCGADHTKCKAHHTMPWNAPAKGETDITKLVLVCDSCHHQIHEDHLQGLRRRPLETAPSTTPRNSPTTTTQTKPRTSTPTHLEPRAQDKRRQAAHVEHAALICRWKPQASNGCRKQLD